SRRITTRDLALTAGVCFAVGALARFGLGSDSWFTGLPGFSMLADYAARSGRNLEILIGVVLPLILLTVAQWRRRDDDAGAARFARLRTEARGDANVLISADELRQPA